MERYVTLHHGFVAVRKSLFFVLRSDMVFQRFNRFEYFDTALTLITFQFVFTMFKFKMHIKTFNVISFITALGAQNIFGFIFLLVQFLEMFITLLLGFEKHSTIEKAALD